MFLSLNYFQKLYARELFLAAELYVSGASIGHTEDQEYGGVRGEVRCLPTDTLQIFL